MCRGAASLLYEQFPAGRLPGSWPETGLWEIDRLSPRSRLLAGIAVSHSSKVRKSANYRSAPPDGVTGAVARDLAYPRNPVGPSGSYRPNVDYADPNLHRSERSQKLAESSICQHQSLNIELCDEIMYLTPPLKVFAKLRALAGYPRKYLADSEQVADRRIHARDRDFADPVGLDRAWSPVSHVSDRLDIPSIGCDSQDPYRCLHTPECTHVLVYPGNQDARFYYDRHPALELCQYSAR